MRIFGQNGHNGSQRCASDLATRKECKSKVDDYDRNVGAISGIEFRGRDKCISSMIWSTWDMKIELNSEWSFAAFHTFGSSPEISVINVRRGIIRSVKESAGSHCAIENHLKLDDGQSDNILRREWMFEREMIWSFWSIQNIWSHKKLK
jgi:hypothetical protein